MDKELQEVEKIISILKTTSEYKVVEEPNKPVTGWAYSIISTGFDRDAIIGVLKKLAQSADKAKDILFAPSKSDNVGILILSRTEESMRACAGSLQVALVKLQTILAEEKMAKDGTKPVLSFGYQELARVEEKYTMLKLSSASTFGQQGEIEKPVKPPKPTAIVPKAPVVKKPGSREKKEAVNEGPNMVIMRSIGENCLAKDIDDNSVSCELPRKVNGEYAASLIRKFILGLELEGYTCEISKDNVLKITAPSQGDLYNLLARLSRYTPDRGGVLRE